MSAILRTVAGMILAACVARGAQEYDGTRPPRATDSPTATGTNAAPRMANPYPYAFFDPAKASPQIVAPPKDWKLEPMDWGAWYPGAFGVWPAYYGYGPWGPGWGLWWGPPYPCAPFNVYDLDIKIRF